ncbi:MAG: diaminopimelate decarboxylase [Deltaproteobacteria bacterium]|nr:diaminopimelate decarboxylase [Deltaproteobacteria bacterium]HCH64360.1 diaminopimelate decarboxylase [Deltaproteobacteria bacterium]
MNKMGVGPVVSSRSSVAGVNVEALVEAYGSPLFIYDEQIIRARYRALHNALVLRYPKVALAWSYKTCYLDAICRLYHQEGALAEVVSGMEYRKARRNGMTPGQIVYNGPHKDDQTLTEALLGGARVHLDHFDELARCERIAEQHGCRPAVSIRLNLETSTLPRWDRFGFNLDNGQARDAVRRLLAGGRLRLTGLHVHLGTFILDVRAFAEATRKVVAFANRLRSERGIVLDTLDLGGGLASRNRLRSQYLPSDQSVPSFAQYAEQLVDGLSALDYPANELPTLVLETGRALIDEAGSLVTTVVANKRLADGRRGMVVDAGVNTLFTAYWYQHQLVPTQPTSEPPEPTMVYGPLCMNIDVVGNNVMLPPMAVGQRMLVTPVGAYNLSQSMQFIELRPAVCLVRPDGTHTLIRRREVLDDLTRAEVIPPWLGGGR